MSTSGVPQGSVSNLFFPACNPNAALPSHCGADRYQYADDTQLFISIFKSSAFADLHVLEPALADQSNWFSLSCRTLNPTKSEVILLGTHQRNIYSIQ